MDIHNKSVIITGASEGIGAPRPVNAPAPSGQVVDSAEHVANKILEAITREPAEQFME